MRILLYTDVHISQNSSIINTRGNKYSTRLENIIKSLNWAEEQAIVNKCDSIICLGDLFDRSDLNAEEITALKEIKWANLPHILIVGNHESNVVSLDFSSAFSLNSVFDIINKPCSDVYDDFSITYLPYTVESERKSIKEYLPDLKKKIILSHNDIKGIQYGQWISKDGFDIEDINNNCDLFINGHLHNGEWINNKILNLGNLTGANFSEDGFKYKHQIAILDTATLKVEFIENPYAFNFYKLEIRNKDDLKFLNKLKNAVVSIKCSNDLLPLVKESLNNVIESRVTIINETVKTETKEELVQVDHLKQFADYFLTNVDGSEIAKSELAIIIGV